LEEDCNTRLPPRIESAATEWKTSVRISTFWLGSWWRNPCGKLFDSLIQVADLRTKFVHITAERAFQGRVSKKAAHGITRKVRNASRAGCGTKFPERTIFVFRETDTNHS